MSFEFEIGKEEQHKIEFVFSSVWGSTYIKVDGQVVQKHQIKLYSNITAIILLVTLIGDWIIVGTKTFFPIHASIGIIIIGSLQLGSTILYRKRYPMTVMVGEKEKHSVRIERTWKLFPAWRSVPYQVYVDGELYQTIDG
ncbi:MAG: hypothetical protein ACXADY_22230 [Candidatus Hodarchaeales archaeon]